MKNTNTKPTFVITAIMLFFISLQAHSNDNPTILYYSNGDSTVYYNNIADTILFEANGKLRQDIDKQVKYYERNEKLYALVTYKKQTKAYPAQIKGTISVFSILEDRYFSFQHKPLIFYSHENIKPILASNPNCLNLISDIDSLKLLKITLYGGTILASLVTFINMGRGLANDFSDIKIPFFGIVGCSIGVAATEYKMKNNFKKAILEYNKNPNNKYKTTSD